MSLPSHAAGLGVALDERGHQMGAEPGGNEGVGLVGKGVQEGDGQRESLEEGGQDAAHCAPPPSSGCVQLGLHHAHVSVSSA